MATVNNDLIIGYISGSHPGKRRKDNLILTSDLGIDIKLISYTDSCAKKALMGMRL